MRVTYTHRLGQHQRGHTVTLTDHEAQWLLAHGHATPADTAAEPPDDAPAPEETRRGPRRGRRTHSSH